MPKTLTNYYQESGRAGRDGEVSDCVLFFHYRDKVKLSTMIAKSIEERNQHGSSSSKANFQRQMFSLNKCLLYCLDEVECRRSMMLQYFGESFNRDECGGTCDNCQFRALYPDSVQTIDLTFHACQLLQLLFQVAKENLPKLTVLKLAKLYCGSKDKELQRYLHLHPSSSKGSANQSAVPLTKDLCEKMIQRMVIQEYLAEEHVITNAFNQFGADYITVGSKAGDLLKNNGEMVLTIRKKAASAVSSTTSSKNANEFTEISLPSQSKGTRARQPNRDLSDLSDAGKKTSKKTTRRPVPIVQINSDEELDGSPLPSINHVRKRKAEEVLNIEDLTGKDSTFPQHKMSLLSNKQKMLLREWLEEFRKIWEKYWNYLPNAAIDAIVDKIPNNIAELSLVNNMGETKANLHGPKILATIYAFIEQNDLLHLFRDLEQPTIAECPTWKAPFSKEAEQKRQSLQTSVARRFPSSHPQNEQNFPFVDVETDFRSFHY